MIGTPHREISQLQQEISRQKLPVDQYCGSGFEILVRPDESMNEKVGKYDLRASLVMDGAGNMVLRVYASDSSCLGLENRRI